MKTNRIIKIYDQSNFSVDNILKDINSEDQLSYDVESTGLNVRKEQLIGVSFANSTTTSYIILKKWQSSKLEEIITLNTIKPILQALLSKKLVMWNASYDTRITLAQTGIDLLPSLHADAMLALHTLDENRMSYGLKQVGKEVFGLDAGSEQDDMLESISGNGGSKKQYFMADSDILAKYGAQDAALTFDLWKRFEADLEAEPKLKALFFEETMPLYTTVVIPMELKGIPVDIELMQNAKKDILADIDKIETSIYRQIEPLLGGFNDWYIRTKYPFKLSGRFKELLGKELAPQGWPLTDKGVISLSKVEIEKHKKKGLLAHDTHFERLINQQEHVPPVLIQKIQLQLMAEDGIKNPFNLSSTDHLKRLFFGTSTTPSLLKETPLSKTPTGAGQIDDNFLDNMAKKYPWAKELQELRGLQKIYSTYIERFLDEQENGVYYPSYFMHRTVSGRLSGSFQQLPRPHSDDTVEHGDVSELEAHYNNKIRHFFKAQEGFMFTDNDYESLEPHVFAHVSGDKKLIELFNNGHDFYSTVAINTEKLQGYSADKKADNYFGKLNKDARQKAKTYALAIPYGRESYGLSMDLNCSESEAKKLLQGYLEGFPELKKWMDKTKILWSEQGYIETEFGRRRRFPEQAELYRKYGNKLFDALELWKAYHERPQTYDFMKQVAGKVKNARNNALNVQAQGLAGHIINRASISLAKALKDANMATYICGSIHDELLLYGPESEAPEAAKIMQNCMENTVKLSLKLKAVPSFGKTYGESKG
jgi:DNA polymerase I-like protein with 3'-5' exonuclease and polymerase domains